MGFYSEVQVVAQKKALEILRPVFEREWPQADIGECDRYGSIRLDWVKWYDDFPEVKAVNEAAKRLRSEEFNEQDGYGFKMVVLNEDDTHWETCNDKGDAEFYDFGVACEIENPWDLSGEKE